MTLPGVMAKHSKMSFPHRCKEKHILVRNLLLYSICIYSVSNHQQQKWAIVKYWISLKKIDPDGASWICLFKWSLMMVWLTVWNSMQLTLDFKRFVYSEENALNNMLFLEIRFRHKGITLSNIMHVWRWSRINNILAFVTGCSIKTRLTSVKTC